MTGIIASLPPMLDTEMGHFIEVAPRLTKLDGFILNDNGWGVSNLVLASLMKEATGKDGIPHFILRDKNRIALKGDLTSCLALGIETIVVSTGRHPSLTLFPDAKPVYDFDQRQAIRFFREESSMNIGAELWLGSDSQWAYAQVLADEGLDFIKIGREAWADRTTDISEMDVDFWWKVQPSEVEELAAVYPKAAKPPKCVILPATSGKEDEIVKFLDRLHDIVRGG